MATLTSPTLIGLITELRQLLNQQDRNNSFWSDEELTGYLNDAIKRYFVEVTLVNEGHFTTTADLNIVADAESITLPTDCFEIKSLWKKVTDGYVVLPYQNSITSGYSTSGGTAPLSYFPLYYFRGNSIILRPTPNFSETAGLKLEYIQFPDFMVNGGDSLTAQIAPVFKELVVSYAVYKAKWKETLVNGVQVHKAAEELASSCYTSFKDCIERRSKYPTYTTPFNPEIEGA